MTRALCISILFHLIASIPIRGQVINDNIENRIKLELEKPFSSTTNGCTVQWDCVDESLTGKCIDYHNDQWFAFNSSSHPKLFINVSNQECRDMRGVQIVVLKGEPCDVSTYEILTCVSLANQDDIFVELNSLEKEQEYLINIDGYLHDFCSFEIEVSQFAKGLSLAESLDLNASSTSSKHIINIDWELPDSLHNSITGFQIFRRIEPDLKSSFYADVPLEANAFGDIQDNYSFKDSIAANKTYFYKLVAKYSEERFVLIDNFKFRYNFTPKQARFIRSVRIPFEQARHKDSITIIVIDPRTGKVLDHEVFTYSKKDPKYLNYRTVKALQHDIERIEVKVINNSSKITEKYTFGLWDE